jgi:hypothetical protein
MRSGGDWTFNCGVVPSLNQRSIPMHPARPKLSPEHGGGTQWQDALDHYLSSLGASFDVDAGRESYDYRIALGASYGCDLRRRRSGFTSGVCAVMTDWPGLRKTM